MDDKRAEELVDRYADLLLRMGYTWFGNLPDAQDLCQTVFLKLLEDGRTFPDSGQERAWVIRVAVNSCKNQRRSILRRRTVPLEEGLTVAAEAPDLDGDSVLSLVQSLPQKYRQVVYLRYYEEYRVEEIAQLLGVKPALVSTWLSRARAKLKHMMEGEQYENSLQE